AYQFLSEIERGNTTVIRVRASDEERAKQILYRFADKDFSFNDAISFVVMERLGIGAAFTFDRDFAQYGLPILRVDSL
ncbi:MAG: PIN domain-containing protein, partial [Chloroflexi bacterium]|nr:PIN domain-containing protein [Chloroflexota bacterium]